MFQLYRICQVFTGSHKYQHMPTAHIGLNAGNVMWECVRNRHLSIVT